MTTITTSLPRPYPEHIVDQRLYWEDILRAAYAAATENEHDMHATLFIAERHGPVPDFLASMMSQEMEGVGNEWREDAHHWHAEAVKLHSRIGELTAEIAKLKKGKIE